MNEDSCKCFASEKWRILIKTLKNCYLWTLSNEYVIILLHELSIRSRFVDVENIDYHVFI